MTDRARAMKRVIVVAGARPNFVKVAPLVRALDARAEVFERLLVHTGQHYDAAMSGGFFDALGLPAPDIHLGAGSGSHAEQTGRVMIEFEKVVQAREPGLVLVVGDVNSTLACALAARKLGVAVAHVEAGLRSGDLSMPEEINRRCTDVLSDLLFTTDELASDNLRHEGVAAARIHFVGNVMIDSLLRHRAAAARDPSLARLGLDASNYALVTLHRPSNVDDPRRLHDLVAVLRELSQTLPVVFPVHPRTRARLASAGVAQSLAAQPGMRLLEPLGYIAFLNLTMHARLVLTDSGGLQEETTALGVPCLTLRPNTERPITVSQGSNRVVGDDPDAVRAGIEQALAADRSTYRVPDKWDGRTAERIVEILATQGPPA